MRSTKATDFHRRCSSRFFVARHLEMMLIGGRKLALAAIFLLISVLWRLFFIRLVDEGSGPILLAVVRIVTA